MSGGGSRLGGGGVVVVVTQSVTRLKLSFCSVAIGHIARDLVMGKMIVVVMGAGVCRSEEIGQVGEGS